MPRSRATLAQRTASMITPAELGESQTSSLSSRLSGTSPKFRPSIRMYAHLRSFEPGHVVRRPDVDVVGVEDVVLDLAGHGLGLGDLLRLEALALEHVLEVHVAAEVELVGAVEGEATVLEEPGEDPVDDGGAHLALDVVTDDGHAGVAELARPTRGRWR